MPADFGCGGPGSPSGLPPTARACGCCPCRPEPAGARMAQLSTDLQTTFSNLKLECHPFSGSKPRGTSAACKNRNQPCQARGYRCCLDPNSLLTRPKPDRLNC